MSNLTQVLQLIEWLKELNFQWLQNEDEVETKFVIPLFQKLGYRDECYRGKYPTVIYHPSKKGRKPESDRVYFSVDTPEFQNRDTSLIVIEAKEPKNRKLGEAIRQAEFYETHLKPVFLVATNGHNLKIIKPHRYAESEIVFDLTVEELLNFEMAKELYSQLNFEVVAKIKRENQEAAKALPHEKYILLEKSLRQYPELESILKLGDFSPEIQSSKGKLKIVKPKVSVECELPLLLKEGSCKIEFSNILRRGLKIQVKHQDILGKFMVGLGTSPDWGTRSFIEKSNEDAYSVSLGEVSTTLSRAEVEDLCSCVDEICEKYKEIILEVEALLEAENYEPVQIPIYHKPGFYLLSVQQWFWDLMKQFSEAHYRDIEKSEWDIFEWNARAIRIELSFDTNAWLYPVHSNGGGSDDLLGGYVDVIYGMDSSFHSFGCLDKTTWQQNVGTKGIWTVDYTKNWLLNKLIPKVEDYYSEKFRAYYYQFSYPSEEREHHPYVSHNTDSSRRIALEEISEIEHLAPYLHDVQAWIHIYFYNIDALILRPYYKAFIELCMQADFSTAQVDYLVKKLYAIELRHTRQRCDLNLLRCLDKDYVIESLNQHLERLDKIQTESYRNADLISRVFISITANCKIRYSQSQLNAAKQALEPLLRQSRFEERYVFPNR